MVYFDFAKSFDKVYHGILKVKLRSLGIDGKTGQWLSRFLEYRLQVV